MPLPALKPLADIPIQPHIAALPKADIHIHQEWSPRLDKVLARQEGRAPYNWRAWAASLMHTVPPGAARLHHLSSHFPAPLEADAQPHTFVARVVHMLEEAAADGAVLVETRLGRDMADRPDCLTLFRAAERQVQGAVSALACRRDALRASAMGGSKSGAYGANVSRMGRPEADLWCRCL